MQIYCNPSCNQIFNSGFIQCFEYFFIKHTFYYIRALSVFKTIMPIFFKITGWNFFNKITVYS
ncbi:MAG: hypothetical protein A2W05_04410 [Candidatus Schekmanbacteria bacterium RBG_16_38_10]|uniref:Uncharacterized protein n=1 Tax=Candidatus Schekmanbacteria bacterium RBG_16_38_10 TaxID=1817879 RepID=A0A1F7RQQ1_9BACT|nr:MAG: hypothetical protein A2W05_04410 [Candidatus Schekmanbacteria bacterium RBG_16_38_10]